MCVCVFNLLFPPLSGSQIGFTGLGHVLRQAYFHEPYSPHMHKKKTRVHLNTHEITNNIHNHFSEETQYLFSHSHAHTNTHIRS